MIKYRIWIQFEWIPSELNELADSLSRYNLTKFWYTVNLFNIEIPYKPVDIIYFDNYTFMSDKNKQYEDDMVEYNKFINWLKIPMKERHKYPYNW